MDSGVVVTNVVNPTPFLLKILVFRLRLTTFVTEAREGRFKMLQIDDVYNAWLLCAVSPSPASHGEASDWGGNGGFAALGAL